MPTAASSVHSVTRSLRLLETLADASGDGESELGVTEIARRTNLSPATTHRLLATLGAEGYVTKDSVTSRYRLGSRLFALSYAAESRITTLRAQASDAMEDLKTQYGETVNLAVLERRHVIYVHQVESERPVRAFNRIGNRILAHASAAGKVLLAFEPEGAVVSLLPHDRLESLTPATIVSPQILLQQLATVRMRGYALDLGEQDEEVVCVAAPILVPGRRPAAALSISGPANRMQKLDLDAVGGALVTAARRVPEGSR